MDTISRMALGLMGQLRARPATGDTQREIGLPPAQTTGGMPLMEALAGRQSQREFSSAALAPQQLSNLLWACAGVNRPEVGGRTAPSAMDSQEVDLHVAMAGGLYRYEPRTHRLALSVAADVRRVTGYQDFVDEAALDLVYVGELDRMKLVPAALREGYACVAAGAMSQNASLYCASQGLATVIRAWLDRDSLARAMSLNADQRILLAQTVGHPKPA